MQKDPIDIGRPDVQPAAEVLERLASSETGLSQAEATARLARFGRNELPHKPPPALWQIVLRQFQSPLIYILAAAALVSAAIGDFKDAGFIGIVLVLNAAIGGYQEWRAEQSSRALQKLLKIRASVVRDDETLEIDAEELVPGDIVWIESGNRVPADIRLLSSHGLEVDESLLTGESLPVPKDAQFIGQERAPLGDRLNMAYAASIVVRGRGYGVVVATGTETVVGQLARDVLQAAGGTPPLLERMERFSRTVAIAVLVVAVLVALIGVLWRGYSPQTMFFFTVALAVSAIPEGLPAALSVALAIATTRMARRGVIVRRLAAVEGLGSCTLVATDKTGTLTCNELTVRAVRLTDSTTLEVTGQGFAPIGEVLLDGSKADANDPRLAAVARAAALCNEAQLHLHDGEWVWHGDPVDVAFLSMAHKMGWEREVALTTHPEVNSIPYEPERQYAATYHAVDGDTLVLVKGAPERVLAMCDLEPAGKQELLAHAEQMAARGFRVLAVAEGYLGYEMSPSEVPKDPSGLTLLGFAGMIDPLRPGVRQAVEQCQEAGVQVTMVTGDHPITALAIGRELGLATSEQQVVTGIELEDAGPDALPRLVQQIRIFARVSPHQKLQIVQAARNAGHFVAVTGDGVNDAPALRTANIGIAMGKSGTDVAREAAELVLSDDNFTTIVAGIEEGRIAYDNVRNVIYLLISTGAAEVIVAGLALIAGLPLPLLPVQLLWLNLVTNGIQGVALAFEPGKGDELHRSPRSPQEKIFNRLMIERTIIGSGVIGVVAFGAFWALLSAGWSEPEARNALLLLMVLFENVHIGNCRSETRSAFRISPLSSPFLLFGALSALLVHVVGMYWPPLQAVLQTAPLSPNIWLMLAALALTVLIAIELHKLSWHLRGRNHTRNHDK